MLFRRLRALGLSLLRLVFLTRAAECPPTPTSGPAALLRTARVRHPTTYRSVFGKRTFARHAFLAPGRARLPG
jgi:hypothetical protein